LAASPVKRPPRMQNERMTGGDGGGGDITVTAAASDTGDATVTAADTGDATVTAAAGDTATGDITVTPPAFTAALTEAGRQVTICNACRYCEGYCAVFPAMFARRAHAAADLVQLANLCHNCRGCYYACQYAPPHEFALNLPAALAEAQAASWREFAWPAAFARLFERAGSAIAALMVAAFALLLGAASAPGPAAGSGFYATLSHAFMVAVFAPAFIAPLLAIGVSLRRYWRFVGGGAGAGVGVGGGDGAGVGDGTPPRHPRSLLSGGGDVDGGDGAGDGDGTHPRHPRSLLSGGGGAGAGAGAGGAGVGDGDDDPKPRLIDLWRAVKDAAAMRNLRGGGDGCNFEDADRFSHARRRLHQLTVGGFGLCFAATCAGALLHYAFDSPAPYRWFDAPKLLGVPGGVLLCVGSAGLAYLKTRAESGLSAAALRRGEFAFVALLVTVSATGLALYAATATTAVAWLLPLHLATVLTLFALTPYTKMAHGFYRLTALLKNQTRQR